MLAERVGMAKSKLAAKIVKHAHRRAFQEYVRHKGRDKTTIGYVYLMMFLRSGEGNRFELKEELFLADLGLGKNAFRSARKTLMDDGWLSRGTQKIDPLTGKWGLVEYTVNVEPVAHLEGGGTVDENIADLFTGGGSTGGGSAGDRKEGDTVVLHSLYGTDVPSTLNCTPSASTGSVVSSLISELADDSLRSSPTSLTPKEKNNPNTSSSPLEQQNPKPTPDELLEELMQDLADANNVELSDLRVQYQQLAEILHEPFGMPYITTDDTEIVAKIAAWSLVHDLTPHDVVSLAAWARDPKNRFWAARTPTYDSLAKHMKNTKETGLVAQYRAKVKQPKDKQRRVEPLWDGYCTVCHKVKPYGGRTVCYSCDGGYEAVGDS
jgi:hypothetical protein